MKRISCVLMLSTVSLFGNDSSPQDAKASSCSKPDGFQYWVDASFTYWCATEDGLNSAESAQVDSSATTVFASNPTIFKQSFKFNPGFKVGIGLSFSQDWLLHAEYTYYRGKNHVSRNAPAGSIGVGVWNVDSWYNQRTFFSDQSLTGTKLATTWKIAMDMGDLLLSRPFSEMKGFVLAPFGGLRTVWIHQKMNLRLTEAGASFGGDAFLGPQPLASNNLSHSWAIGPRLGVEGRFNLPMGFNLTGVTGASVLFNRFSKIKHSEAAAATFYDTPAPISVSYNSVRPELDMSLGLGWGMDICKKQRVDLTASYDFIYFWGQNMMRYIVDEFFAGTSAGSLDLYFQGLTIKASYGF